MTKKIKSRIPEFKSYEDEANFWDTHSVTDFEDETEDVEIIFDLGKTRDESLILRLQSKIKEQLKKLAQRRGLNVSALARMWILERLEKEIKVGKFAVAN